MNDSFWMNRLHENPNLLPIALEWEDQLAENLGYQGPSSFVMFWEEIDTNSLNWFDGAFGSQGNVQAWWRWRHERMVRVALRGIRLQADFTEKNAYALLLDRCSQRFYVGRLPVVRELVVQLNEEQGLSQRTRELFDRLHMDPEHPEDFSEEQLMGILEFIDQGGGRPDPGKLH